MESESISQLYQRNFFSSFLTFSLSLSYYPSIYLSPFSVRWNKIPSAENLGNFELLIDEELAAQTQDDNSLLGNITTGKQRVNNRWK